MKLNKLLLIAFFSVALSSCSSIRYVTVTKNGMIVNQDHQRVNIVGNPHMVCIDNDNKILADGYFVYQKDDGSFVIDEFGKRYVTVNCATANNVLCDFGLDEK